MGKIRSGISQIGGKFRLVNTIQQYIPFHNFYLEPFLGAGWILLNKPRCQYECANDLNSELINYYLIIREHPEEFDELKKGVFGLVSQEICNRIVSGELMPRNNIERAYFFYYLNKTTFGSTLWQVREKPPWKGIDPTDQAGKWKTGGYKGIGAAQHDFQSKMKKAQNKGINPKTTRPYTNNDCGLLSPLDKEAIKRLRYVNLTTYPFQKVYRLFYRAFYEKKGLGPECFIYFDPPYPGTEKHYKTGFGKKDHLDLINIIKESPFHCLLSIGGDCEFYLKALKDFIQVPVKVRYATDANTQKESQEYLIMNYDIKEQGLMEQDASQKRLSDFF